MTTISDLQVTVDLDAPQVDKTQKFANADVIIKAVSSPSQRRTRIERLKEKNYELRRITNDLDYDTGNNLEEL